MSWETGKAVARRTHDHRFATRYYVGRGCDIGAGNDSLAYYQHLFPLMTEVVSWDKEQGDAQYMSGVPDASFDWVNSSHCLEHLHDSRAALHNWIRITKPGGHIIVVVPDAQLYEHGMWPSVRNPDHKWSFAISEIRHEEGCLSLLFMLGLIPEVEVLKIELLDRGFRYGVDQLMYDQSALTCCEPAIEFILRRK
jgi:SAM-dependent methyltransferase